MTCEGLTRRSRNFGLKKQLKVQSLCNIQPSQLSHDSQANRATMTFMSQMTQRTCLVRYACWFVCLRVIILGNTCKVYLQNQYISTLHVACDLLSQSLKALSPHPHQPILNSKVKVGQVAHLVWHGGVEYGCSWFYRPPIGQLMLPQGACSQKRTY